MEDARNNNCLQVKLIRSDSYPETKPARPDAIDMEEDEIEILQEARA